MRDFSLSGNGQTEHKGSPKGVYWIRVLSTQMVKSSLALASTTIFTTKIVKLIAIKRIRSFMIHGSSLTLCKENLKNMVLVV